MGWGVSYAESYPAILDILLDCEYRCLNLGCSGFGTIAETEKSIQLWDKFPGNFSVLQFCTNDYDDDEMAKSHSQKPAFLHSVLDSYNWFKHRFYTPNFPYTLYYLRHFRTLLDSLPNDIAIGKPCLSNTPDFKPIDVGPGMSNPDYGRLSKAALLKYRNFLAENKVPFMVVALPLGEESIDFTKFCKENDIECYLFDIPGDLQLRNEGHLNQLGNYKLAQFVSSWIKKTRLITP
jgi:hypothetical protein